MPLDAVPAVRAVVLNYNGGRHVLRCVEHLLGTEWPAERFEVVVVDNASTDGSDRRIEETFDGVPVVRTGANLGFPANNVAMRNLDGVDHVALVNNDAFVEPGWLAPLVAELEADPELGAVCPRILFAPSFHTVEVVAPTFRPPGDGRLLAVRLHAVELRGEDRTRLAHPREEVHALEAGPGGPFRWMGGRARFRLPVDAGDTSFGTARLLLSAERTKAVSITCTDYRVHAEVGPEPRWVTVPFWGEPYDVVNNAGSVVIDDGYGGDRGFLEVDRGQFDQPVEVFNWCGGGVLLRRRYLEEVGLFDERFFLYYEDTDLSWRGQLAGWRYRYVPDSVLRHLHGASAGEGSDVFAHFVERNRLLMLLKDAPPRLAYGAPLRYLASTASYARRDIARPVLSRQRPHPRLVINRLRSFGGFVKLAPAMLADRRRMRAGPHVPDAEIERRFLPRSRWGVPTPRPRPEAPDIADVEVPRGEGSRVAVYDRWWATAGGGEKFAGGIAEVLARQHDVTLLTHEPLDLVALGERLQLDLSAVHTRRVDLAPEAVSEASEDFDLLVNASYTSEAENRARAGLYVVHFPTPPGPRAMGWRKLAIDRLTPLAAEPGRVLCWVAGLHPPERSGRIRLRWTTGDAHLAVQLPPGERALLRITFGHLLAPEVAPIEAVVEVDGRRVASGTVRSHPGRHGGATVTVTAPVTGAPDGAPVLVRIRSPHHVPADVVGGWDRRRLGVPVLGVQLGRGIRAVAKARHPSLWGVPPTLGWLTSYDRVVANSEYTRTWIRRWWGIDAGLLHPPVTLQPRRAKQPIILSVGRFFAAEHGHSKKQREMVAAFRMLCEGGLTGWELHLVGGCSEADRPYLEQVLRDAEGLPVQVHVDASGDELRRLYGAASIYWHASGLGEDDEADPDRFEHFGITTAEAMSAGAVPVVIGRAGQREVVVDGVSGCWWESLEELVAHTRALIDDPDRLATLSAEAERRAADFGPDAFARTLGGIVERLRAGALEREA